MKKSRRKAAAFLKGEMMKKRIGFIGTGIMGAPMVKNLLKAGYPVQVFNRSKDKAKALEKDGAVFQNTIADLAQNSDVIITMVGYPEDVEEVYFGSEGIFENAKPGTYLIDMTTTSPKLSKAIEAQAKIDGLYALDAPVTGGDKGAREGTLTILVGGEQEDFQTVKPVLQAMGTKIRLMGPAGSGQHTKMANQIAIAGALSGAAEAMAYAKEKGLSMETVLEAISSGAAGSVQMTNVLSRAVEGDYQPGFFLKHFIKDMRIAKAEADSDELELPVLEDVLEISQELEKEGCGDNGTQIILKHYIDE